MRGIVAVVLHGEERVDTTLSLSVTCMATSFPVVLLMACYSQVSASISVAFVKTSHPVVPMAYSQVSDSIPLTFATTSSPVILMARSRVSDFLPVALVTSSNSVFLMAHFARVSDYLPFTFATTSSPVVLMAHSQDFDCLPVAFVTPFSSVALMASSQASDCIHDDFVPTTVPTDATDPRVNSISPSLQPCALQSHIAEGGFNLAPANTAPFLPTSNGY
jgi:hypothetical protein